MSFVSVDNDESFRKLLRSVFTERFMLENTNFENFDGFCYSSAVITNWNANPMVYNEDLLDRFVCESTKFHSWEEMVKTAVDKAFPPN